MVLDKLPLNLLHAPLLSRILPEARFVLALRHPLDVVLSCFRINFTPSTAAWSFSELEETAHHYDALMTLIELCRERLPLACHEVRYDQLEGKRFRHSVQFDRWRPDRDATSCTFDQLEKPLAYDLDRVLA